MLGQTYLFASKPAPTEMDFMRITVVCLAAVALARIGRIRILAHNPGRRAEPVGAGLLATGVCE
jgi:hypothetical protein